MLKSDNAPQKTTKLSLNSKGLEMAHEMEMDASQSADTLLTAEMCRRYWEQWNEENREAVAQYNARIAGEGLPLAKYSTF